jgi:hypothetical protein
MEGFKERVKIEFRELNEKINRLSAFIGSEIFIALSDEDQNDLITQFNAMSDYAAILEKRISRF